MVSAFDHVHIYAADPSATLEFYALHFGAERLGSLPNSHGGENFFLILGAQIVVVSAFPPGMSSVTPPPVGDGATEVGFGIAHIGLNVDDLASQVDALRAAGVPVHGELQDSGPVRYVYVSAPDGVLLELTEYVLPRRLAGLARGVRLFNRAVHVARRAMAKQLLR